MDESKCQGLALEFHHLQSRNGTHPVGDMMKRREKQLDRSQSQPLAVQITGVSLDATFHTSPPARSNVIPTMHMVDIGRREKKESPFSVVLNAVYSF
jgi:hypothetical protein